MITRVSSKAILRLGSSLLLGLLVVATVYGQGERATVTGTATDSSGAIVVGAAVSIRNVDTNLITRTKTNAAGIYYLPALPPGTYDLRIEQAGFRPAAVADIPLGAGMTATFNVTLEVGALAEAVEVQATAVQLEAQTTALGKVLPTRSVAELPALGRNPIFVASLLPGVQPRGGGAIGSDNQFSKMSGGTATQNAIYTDGGETRGFDVRGLVLVPLESVAEVRVDTATYAAEFGRSGGGVVNFVTKSGTNQLHGVIYEFLRNDHLNANSWQNNRSKVPKTLYQQNQFGAAVGGPIVRDRTFFFANFEGLREGIPVTNLNTVPSVAQRQGNFTQTLDGSGRQVIVYDPLTTHPDPTQTGKYVRDAFPGNTVPQGRFNPVSLNVMNYWPASNRTGEGPSGFNNYYTSIKRVTGTDTVLARIDHFVSEKHRLFGRVNVARANSSTAGLTLETVAFPPQTVTNGPKRSAMVSWTSTFKPTLLGELRLSYLRNGSRSYWDGKGFDIASLGFPSSVVNAVRDKTFPSVSISQYTVGTGLSVTSGSSAEVGDLTGSGASYSYSDVWHLQYHLTWMRNRHKIKAGTEQQLQRLGAHNTFSPAGKYFFDRLYTQGPDPLLRSSTAGSGFASFLLGVPVSGNFSFDPYLSVYGRYYAFYLQDDIQLTRKLTANLGLRYEYQTPWAEKHGRFGYFDYDKIDPVTGAKGSFQILQPGQQVADPEKKNFGPRVGLAYSLASKTVIRASGALFYAPADTINATATDWGNGTYLVNEASLGTPNPMPNTPPVGGSWSNPFAAGLLEPSRSETYTGQNLRTFVRRHRFPHLADWTVNIQQMVTPTLLVQVGYIGNKITNFIINRMYNQNDPQYLSLGSKLFDQVPNPFYGKLSQGVLSFPTVERRQLLRPFPQYLQMLMVRDGYGESHYHSFQLRVDKQYSRGLSLSVGYTISKTIANVSETGSEAAPQNALYNPNYSKSLDTNDIPQRLVLSHMYELPFGKGKPYLSEGLVSQVIGNWQLSGIAVFQSGIPLRIAAADATGLLDFGLNVGRGNRLRDPVLPKDERTTSKYFDTSAFTLAPPFTMPNDSITQPRLRDYGRRNFDMSLLRNQKFKERYNVQLRAEVFNIFNTPALRLGTGSSTTVNAVQFGQTLLGDGQRQVQFGLRLLF